MQNPEQRQALQAEIIEWLSKSTIIRKLRTGRGFYVIRGMSVKLEDGNLYDALDWLMGEGIQAGCRLHGYSVAYSPANNHWAEKLTFFIDHDTAPFAPPLRQWSEGTRFEEEGVF